MTGIPSKGTEGQRTRITVYPKGPLIIRGDFLLEDLDRGPVPSGRMIALCRCGRSATKPLCDGSHKITRRGAVGEAPHSEVS